MKRLEDMGNKELIYFLNGQGIMQLSIYCNTYRLVRGISVKKCSKVDMVNRIHKHIVNVRKRCAE